ncbi:drug/metabolite transporter (DMT)-like permease [Fontibacillus phaseoli]|uniref:Drug/metabolite transporter (DMT)-like permease n=1 Tax=Fontibacillus phaseoli TaxID=1416533 RepID=A0A369B1D1_9BACL|nr:DMT family transporter [Fontibacillus phaseoli]RCX15359.1 drug/metabolite transporter (DMT)-like permease [Fontibacillus phaseoli]
MNLKSKSFVSFELLYIIGIIAISFSSIFIRWSNAEVSVVGMYRLYLTNLLMLPLAWKYRKEMFSLTSGQWKGLLLAGAMLGLHFLFWMASLRLTTVASSTVILTLEPILVMFGSFFLFGAKINRPMLAGMALALIGSVAIGSGDFKLSGTALQGDLLSLLGTVAVAAHMLVGKKLLTNMSAFVYNFWVFFTAATMLAGYNAVRGFEFTGYAPREWGIYLLLAIVPTLFGHYLFNWLMKFISASAVSMAVLGEPVFASLLAWMLLKESLTWLQMIAGVVILCGVWIFIRYGKETPAVEPKLSTLKESA